jgi:hypothetical protein
MSHLFLSYSKKDIAFARELRERLVAEGFAVWMDETKLVPSERWWKTIERNINQCAAFIVVMSPHSEASDWVEREILVAEGSKRPIFPVLLDGEAWSRLGNIQHEDMQSGVPVTLPKRFRDGLASYLPPGTGTTPPPLSDVSPQPLPPAPRRPRPLAVFAGIAAAIAVLIGGAVLFSQQQNSPASVTPPALVMQPTDSPAPTLDIAQIVGTLDAEATQAQATQRALDTIAARATGYAQETQAVVRTDQAATVTQAWIPTLTAGQQAMNRPRAGVRANASWQMHAQASFPTSSSSAQTDSDAMTRRRCGL